MPVAPTYNRQFNFTNYQAVNPATPLPATPLDSELSSVKVTLDALIANINLIQRSDGQLANQSVGPQQLQPSLLTGISPPTQWSGAGVSYQVGATVFSGLLFYVCNMANVSSAGNPPATFGAWTLLADFSGVTIPAGSVTSAAFAPGAVNSAALGANLALPGSPSVGDNSTLIATTAFVDAQASAMLAGFKNRVINGAMGIDQRNGGGTGTTIGYTADRWKYNATQISKVVWQRQNTSGLPGFPFFLSASSAGAYSIISTDHFDFGYTIEAIDCYDLNWGTASAQPVTLSFWVHASAAGTYGGALRNSAGTRSYAFSYAVPVANVWQEVSITIPGDTGGTWLNSTTGAGVLITFGLGAGSTFSTTAGSWVAGNFTTATGAQQIVGLASASFAFTGVQFGVGAGAAAAPFEFRPAGQELALCQRYYQARLPHTLGGVTANAVGINQPYGFVVPMRGTPTVTFSMAGGAGYTVGAPSTVTATGFTSNAVGTASAFVATVSWTAEAEL